MKIRTDFVSNSSSSSFIITDKKLKNDESFLKKYNLTKDDFQDVFENLIHNFFETPIVLDSNDVGFLDKVANPLILNDFEKYCEDENIIYWGDDFLNSFFKKNNNKFIYANNFENIIKWNKFYNSLKNIYLLPYSFNPNNNSVFNFKTEKNEKIPENIFNFISDVYKELNICTNADIVKSEFTKLFIHFGDNDIYCIDGINEYGKQDYDSSEKIPDDVNINELKFETESCTIDRICEIIVNYFKEKNKIPNDKKITYKDLLKDIIVWEPHEG